MNSTALDCDPEKMSAGRSERIQTEGGIASNGSTWLVVGADGIACRSIDGGVTWQQGAVGQPIASHVVWNGAAFQVWSPGELHESSDGVSWTSTTITPEGLQIGAVESDGKGGLAAVRGSWGSWDENQAFFHSADGVTWNLASQFDHNDPIRTITFGYGQKPQDCL